MDDCGSIWMIVDGGGASEPQRALLSENAGRAGNRRPQHDAKQAVNVIIVMSL